MNYILIFIMIIVILVIYGLLFRLKNNKVMNTIKTIESFNNNLDEIEKIYKTGSKKFFTGYWTTNNTTILGSPPNSTPTNTSKITFEDDDNNELKGNLYINKKNLEFIVDASGNISTEEIDGIKYIISPNPNIKSYRLGFEIPQNIPSAELIPSGKQNSANEENSLIFKLNENGNLDNKISEMLRKNTGGFNPVSPTSDGLFYSLPVINRIKNYKFREDAITPIYEDVESILKDTNPREKNNNMKLIKRMLKSIKENYDNQIFFQIIRKFHFSNEQEYTTRFSQAYKLEFIKDKKILTGFKHRKLKHELAENKILNRCYNIDNYIYMFVNNGISIDYEYTEPKFRFMKQELKPKNNLHKFLEFNMEAPSINSAIKVVDAKFKPVLYMKKNTFDKNDVKSSIEKDFLSRDFFRSFRQNGPNPN